MSDSPTISIIVPARNAAPFLATTLAAIRAGSSAPLELIVVDDASTDDTAQVADRLADRVVRLPPPAGGPAAARNAGAGHARGDWLLFVDADIRLHGHALARVTDFISAHPECVAVFGSYDDAPAAPGIVSRFRNLLHHYVHQRAPGPASTFWAGIGAIRRDELLAAGGFDADRYPEPAIEDIELGYRIGDRGGRIALDPTIQGTHLKGWTLGSMVATDFGRRGVPWARLLLERRGRSAGSLAAGRAETAKAALAGIAAVVTLRWLVVGGVPLGVAAAGAWIALTSWNLPIYRWFARREGLLFALASIPLLSVFYLIGAAAAATGTGRFLLDRLGASRGRPRQGRRND